MQTGDEAVFANILKGRLYISGKLIHLQSMTVVTSEGVEGDPADAVRLAEQLAKLANVSASGPRSDIRKMETDLANQLIDKLLGAASVFHAPRASGVLASQAFAEGVYLTRKKPRKIVS